MSAALWVLCLAVACSRPPGDRLDQATRGILPANIDRIGRVLAADGMAGRHHASPEADSAAAFILHELLRMGIPRSPSSASLLGKHPVCFVHAFSVGLEEVGRGTRFAVTNGVDTRTAQPGEDFLPLVFSRPEETTGSVARLGSDDATFAAGVRDTLRGRVVLMDAAALSVPADSPADAALYDTARRLTDLGAAAVVFLNFGAWQRLASTCYPSWLPPELAAAARSSYGLRLNLTPSRLCVGLQARAWRLAPERTCPALVVRPGWSPPQPAREAGVQVDFVPEVSLGQNILVGFGGGSASDEIVLLYAHYDHAGINSAGEILNGADDATGVAALLELARALAGVHAGCRRSVLLLFAAAELQGGQGGEMLLHDLQLLLGRAAPVAALGLDGVGRGGPDLIRVLGAGVWPDLARVLERHNDRVALEAPALLLEPQGPPARVGDAAAAPWDHAATHGLLVGAGVPSLLLHDALDPLRSGPDDDWLGVDVEKVTRVARLVFRATWDLTQEQGADAAWARPPR